MTPEYLAVFESAMTAALELADQGSGSDADADVPIGAVVLAPDGAIIGLGRNQ